MTVADRHTYCTWVKHALTALGPSRLRSVYDWIKLNEAVPAADLLGQTANGECLFEKEVRFARWQLRREGVVDGSLRGVWTLARPK